MKRRGGHDIPAAAPGHAPAPTPAARAAGAKAGTGARPAKAARTPAVKPQATSAKSGRRGQ